MAQWKIRRRQGECSACDHAFADGERHASLLRVDGDEIQRGDLCDACWEQHDHGDDLIFWFTRHQEDKKRTLALDLATMERLFLELADKDSDALKEVRYLLCLLLMRKRKLKLERVKRAKDAELLVMRRPRRKDLHEVQVFDFDAERMDELRGRLQEVLEGASFDEDDEGDSSTTRSDATEERDVVSHEEAGDDLQAPVAEARAAAAEADESDDDAAKPDGDTADADARDVTHS